jgi:ParB family chromosome partitioning protein
MGRKNLLADLINGELTAVNSPPSLGENPPDKKPLQPTLGTHGAVGAMSRSLEQISAERDAAKALEARFAAGQHVVEIDTALIDASFVSDRMKSADQDHASLVESIRQHGQQVPVLLRPHPDSHGRYQVAYGHRRIRALSELARPARAVIRELSDDELVVAQGQENNERKDLSFIERATFAATLEDRSFGRETIMTALSVDKNELSRLISVSRAIPRHIVETIGPASKAGRRRWMELAARLTTRGAEHATTEVLSDTNFLSSSSDERFAKLFAALAPRRPKGPRPTIWSDPSGKKVARIERSEERITLALDQKAAPAFGDFIVERLPELYRAFRESIHEG